MCMANGCIYVDALVPVKQAIQNGADYGRNGKGVVYLFAAGNDALYGGLLSISQFHSLLLPFHSFPYLIT
jgi:hypothetical protein